MHKVILLFLSLVLFSNGVAMAALVDNGDGTVTDTTTGLMWQKATAPGTYTWQQALAYAEGLTLAGHSDWRLPNRNEVRTLVDYSRYNQAIDPLLAANTVSSNYWSSTTLAHNAIFAWQVYFGSGIEYGNPKSGSGYVRAVRGGQSGPPINPNGPFKLPESLKSIGDTCHSGYCPNENYVVIFGGKYGEVDSDTNKIYIIDLNVPDAYLSSETLPAAHKIDGVAYYPPNNNLYLMNETIDDIWRWDCAEKKIYTTAPNGTDLPSIANNANGWDYDASTGRIYGTGSYNSSASYYYDPSTNTVTNYGYHPVAGHRARTQCLGNGICYTFGRQRSGPHYEIYKLDVNTNSFTYIQNGPTDGAERSGYFPSVNTIYYWGNWGSDRGLYKFDIATESYSTLTPLAPNSMQEGVKIGNKFLMYGGGRSAFSDGIWIWDPLTDENAGPIPFMLSSNITVISPSDITVVQDQPVTISWSGNLSNGVVWLAYDEDNILNNGNHMWISTDRPQSGSYTWNTNNTSPGIYYIMGFITDGTNSGYAYAPGKVTVTQPDPRRQIYYGDDPNFDPDDIFWFVHITDSHIGKRDENKSRLQWVADNIPSVINPRFIVNTGDLTDGSNCERDLGCEPMRDIWEPDWMPGPRPDGPHIQEWTDYYNKVKDIPSYYDIPGNHDRYDDTEWDGETGLDGYKYYGVRGSASPTEDSKSGPLESQYSWSEASNLFLAINTCDEVGISFDDYQIINAAGSDIVSPLFGSDLPALSPTELSNIKDTLESFRDSGNSGLIFLFGHHSIVTEDRKLPGLYDEKGYVLNSVYRGTEWGSETLELFDASTFPEQENGQPVTAWIDNGVLPGWDDFSYMGKDADNPDILTGCSGINGFWEEGSIVVAHRPDRGARDLINYMEQFKVSAYLYGHIHTEDQSVYFVKDPHNPSKKSLVMNTGSLESGYFRVIAMDNGGVSTATAILDEWPIVLITSPIANFLDSGDENPYSHKVYRGTNKTIRALVFSDSTVSDGEVWYGIRTYVNEIPVLVQQGFLSKSSTINSLWYTDEWDTSVLEKGLEYELEVSCRGISHTIIIKIASSDPSISTDHSSLSNSCDQGSNADNQTLNIWNGGSGSITYSITTDANWLSVTPPSETSIGEQDSITVTYSTSTLQPGLYTGTITIADPNAVNNPVNILVSLTVNDAPVAVDDAATMAEDSSDNEIDILANDYDNDTGDSISLDAIISGPIHGTASIVNGKIRYTPEANYAGLDSLTYQISDNYNAIDTATVSLAVTAQNDTPGIVGTIPDQIKDEDAPSWTLDLTAYESDVEDSGTALNWSVSEVNTALFTAVITDSDSDILTFTPVANAYGSDVITLILTDSGGLTDTQDITVTLNSQNDSPTFTSTPVTYATEDDVYTYNVTATDVDAGDTLTITGTPAWLTLTDNGDGTASLTGTPTNDDVGDHAVELTVTDSAGATDTQSFTISVSNTNDAPTISGTPSTSVDEDTAYSFTPTANDMDIGDTLTFSITNKPAWASFDTSTGSLTGTPDNDDVGTTTGIVITVTDSRGANASLPAFDLTVVTKPVQKGDINGDGNVDLTDAILAIQIVSGITPTQAVYAGADVNGDGKIGIEEVIYILQKVSGMRQ